MYRIRFSELLVIVHRTYHRTRLEGCKLTNKYFLPFCCSCYLLGNSLSVMTHERGCE